MSGVRNFTAAIALSSLASGTLTLIPVQAQSCSSPSEFTPPASDTRTYENQEAGFSFEFPSNYRAVLVRQGTIDIVTPLEYEYRQCLVRTGTSPEITEPEQPPATVSFISISAGTPLEEAARENTYEGSYSEWTSTTFSGRTAVMSSTYGNESYDVITTAFFTPDSRYLMVVIWADDQPAVPNLIDSTLAFE